MKKILLTIALAAAFLQAGAQGAEQEKQGQNEGFQFTTVKANPITSIKDQASSGTCWCFSTLSFLESEMIRQGCKDEDLNLSQMFVVSNAYADKAVKYIRVDGHLNYDQGSSSSDVIYVLKDHGIVPNEAMPGLNYGTDRHRHSELVAGLKGYMNGIMRNPNGKLSTAWKKGLEGILAAYLGEVPETFTYKGTEYTPKSYLATLPINLDDYIEVCSWTHIPYYELHPVEVADNWRWSSAYNVHLDELIAIIDNAIENGYTIAWGTDCSETGFTRDGIGVMPDMEAIRKKVEEVGSDQAHWVGGTTANSRPQITGPVPEITVTEEYRQEGYENKTTTDDHGMHIYGIAKDQNGTKYYMVKNSWGVTGKYDGIWYVSEAFVRAKTMDIMIHKGALPKEISKKLGL